MTHQYAGNPAVYPPNVSEVDDADLNPATAIVLNVGTQNLADRTAYLKANLGAQQVIELGSPWSNSDVVGVTPFMRTATVNVNYVQAPFCLAGNENLGGGITAVSNTTPVVITTTGAHGRSLNDVVWVFVPGVPTLSASYWMVNPLTANTLQLIGSTASGSGSSGSVSLPAFGVHTFKDHVLFTDAFDVGATFSPSTFSTINMRYAMAIAEVPTGSLPAFGQVGGVDMSPLPVPCGQSIPGTVAGIGNANLRALYIPQHRVGRLQFVLTAAWQGGGSAGQGVIDGDVSSIFTHYRTVV